LIKKANDLETTRPTRMRPETITSWDRGRDQDQSQVCRTDGQTVRRTDRIDSVPNQPRSAATQWTAIKCIPEVVGKASTILIGIEISLTHPLIFTGGSKSLKCGVV